MPGIVQRAQRDRRARTSARLDRRSCRCAAGSEPRHVSAMPKRPQSPPASHQHRARGAQARHLAASLCADGHGVDAQTVTVTTEDGVRTTAGGLPTHALPSLWLLIWCKARHIKSARWGAHHGALPTHPQVDVPQHTVICWRAGVGRCSRGADGCPRGYLRLRRGGAVCAARVAPRPGSDGARVVGRGGHPAAGVCVERGAALAARHGARGQPP